MFRAYSRRLGFCVSLRPGLRGQSDHGRCRRLRRHLRRRHRGRPGVPSLDPATELASTFEPRVAEAVFNEQGNGIVGSRAANQLPDGIDPSRVAGDPASGLLTSNTLYGQ